jgi:isopentenyldiphosphate isomerase
MKEEIIYVVDENDNVVRKATRKDVRKNALLHRVVTVILTNSQGKFLVQKRSYKKDIYPGLWDLGMSETVKAGEDYPNAAARGLHEELGIDQFSGKNLEKCFLCKFRFSSPEDNRIVAVYSLNYDGEIRLVDGEVTEFKYAPKEKIKNLVKKENFHPVGKVIFEKYMEMQK